MRIKNVDQLGGGRDLPDHGLSVPFGAEVDIADELGAKLVEQPSVWQQVSNPAPSSQPAVESEAK